MKRIIYLFSAIVTVFFMASCSSDDLLDENNGPQPQVNTRSTMDVAVPIYPTDKVLTYAERASVDQAAAIVTQLFNQTYLFSLKSCIGYELSFHGSGFYIGAFSVNYRGKRIDFRAIDIAKLYQVDELKIYGSSPNHSADIYSPVGRRYYYAMNNGSTNDCLVAVEWSSDSDFEGFVNYSL